MISEIERQLDSFFEEMRSQGIAFNSEMSRYHFTTGGKRLRALIPSWVYEACGADPKKAIPLGCALEMIHNATLVHDDLQDGDTVRRGKATVWKKWSPAQAINCGDALFQFATEMVCRMELPAPALVRVTRRLARGTLEVIEGQAQEFLMKEEESPTYDRYLGVVRGKTAALMATAVVSAMDALELPEAALAAANDAAMQAGILFQLQDDLLDIYGEKQRDRRATDIAEGKVSGLIALFNDRAEPTDRSTMAKILLKPREQTTDAEIAYAIDLLEKYRIKEAALDEIASIRSHLENHSLKTLAPGVHRLIVELSAKFLEPIRSLFA